MKYIDGKTFKKMIISASNNLFNHYPEVDALNVFPVPDGDTGLNMNLTMTSGMKEVVNSIDEDLYSVAKRFSRGLLMGARGNSGSITSQIFKGFAQSFENKSSIDVFGLAEAFDMGRITAYKVVLKPVEGTILTVIRETAEKINEAVTKKMSIEEAFDIILKEARASLDRTPNLLPVLKEVGVVDSGGAGLVYILEGMHSAVHGEVIERNEATAFDRQGAAQVAADDDETEFGYCTEFVLRLGPQDQKKIFNKSRFTSVLNAHGNSLVVAEDDDLVKVHIHTLKPGDIFNYAQQFGEFVKLKCENMTEQHNEILFNEQNNIGPHMAAADVKEAPMAAPKPAKKEKYGIVATSSGQGITELFNELGVTHIVSGGQTMNPSTNDFVQEIEKCNAETVFILPNNGNIIMAANGAHDVLEGKVNVIVIPSKTIMQGVVAAMNFNSDLDEEDNKEVMTEALGMVKSGQVTFAVKDTEINGVEVKKDEFMAIVNNKEIISCHKDKFDALSALLNKMIDEDSAMVTILLGEDVANEQVKKDLEKYLEENFPSIEGDVRMGNQPVYSFIIGIE